MGYDRGGSYPSNFEPNGHPFGLKSNGKLSPRSYPMQCERKWKHGFLSAGSSHQQKALSFTILINKASNENLFPNSPSRSLETFA